MLDFSWSHILILLIVALVVVGPKDLPRLMRIVGQWMGKARAMADEFKRSFDDMARQSELEELRKEIDNLRHQRPLADIDRELNRSIIPDDMKSTPAPPDPVMTPTAPFVEVENPPPEPRSGEFEFPEPHDGATATAPEPVPADGYTPPQP
ncbi:MAG TPA: Sec-independent protein translocase protein TatB [Rhizomicrobium sp.]|jgi:sec-independent protein translocase protein TatB|nr:Sec-independent protein translocase protein TatB [Rhizomicrobium sp.]